MEKNIAHIYILLSIQSKKNKIVVISHCLLKQLRCTIDMADDKSCKQKLLNGFHPVRTSKATSHYGFSFSKVNPSSSKR